ncbi:MAG TPA: hypothetical protein VGP72_13225 [Planctomycetota bacterium]|jgi:tetratricopeptide (TPR) repeat protein
MRAAVLLLLFFSVAALVWALQPPLSAYLTVRRLADAQTDRAECDAALRRAGQTALLALKQGICSSNPNVRAHCGRLLALQGDRDGDRCLTELLRTHSKPEDVVGAKAETFLLSIWDRRDGPPTALRAKLSRASRTADRDLLSALSELIEAYPGWTAGYVMRAKVYLRNGEAFEAKRQAMIALLLEPENFEATVALGDAVLVLGAPEQAYRCLQHAINLNPRLQSSLREDVQNTLKAIEAERARRRQQQRKEMPVI